MKVVVLGNAASIHIVRWANGLVGRGLIVHVVSAHRSLGGFDFRVNVHELKSKAPFGYVGGALELRRLIKFIRPDVLNAHYATGYGVLARLSGFKPSFLSVWGSDVYLFPKKSFIHKYFLKGNLKAASAIGSTSVCMSKAVRENYPHKRIFITPFGIDEDHFCPSSDARVGARVVIGTVKSLKHEYGVDTLIRAFSLALADVGCEFDISLEITGAGGDLAALKTLADEVGISDRVIFHGQVPHAKIPEMLSRLDVYVALSRSESFGVAILEASACERPVVVSDADGPAEVTIHGKTGVIVKKDDPFAAAEAIVKLVRNPSLRSAMGKAGRIHVLEKYTWNKSVDLMVAAYMEVLEGKKRGGVS